MRSDVGQERRDAAREEEGRKQRTLLELSVTVAINHVNTAARPLRHEAREGRDALGIFIPFCRINVPPKESLLSARQMFVWECASVCLRRVCVGVCSTRVSRINRLIAEMSVSVTG